jgi:type I restriction enzyme S subunit
MGLSKRTEQYLPAGWAASSVGEIATYVNGRAFKPSEWKKAGKPIIRIQNLNDDTAQFNYSPVNHEAKYKVSFGDLLFAWSASLGAYIWRGKDAWLNQHIFLVHSNSCTTKLYVFYLLKFITTEFYVKAHGSGMVHVTKGRFEETEVRLPPLPEQHRIVVKIEELFSELDKGIESLKRAQEQLKVYRQALLKHAFEGKLTAKWREENKHNLETADVLVRRIETEREKRYQQRLADWHRELKEWETSGRTDRKPSKPMRSKELSALRDEGLDGLPELPEEWRWLKLGSCNIEVSDGPFGSSLKTSDYVSDGVRVIRLENLGALQFMEEKQSYISGVKYKALEKHTVAAGDIIFASFISGGTRVAVLPAHITRAINKADCFSVRLFGESMNRAFIAPFLSTSSVHRHLESLIHGIGRPRINTVQLKDLPVPLCSPAEQAEIVTAIAQGLSAIESLGKQIESSLSQSEALRQSILKKAFSGQLVPQDPNDEPASKLLERIRAEKAAEAAAAKTSKPTGIPKNTGKKVRKP